MILHEAPYKVSIRDAGGNLFPASTTIFADEQIQEFIQLDLGFGVSSRAVKRIFFTVDINNFQIQNLRLNEGVALQFFSRDESLSIPNFTPYDRFALWVYFNQQRVDHI